MRCRASRQNRSASSIASSFPCFASICARTHAAAMANSSAPMSTARKSTSCRRSSFGPKRTIAWKSVRPSLRVWRSAQRRWLASLPNSPYAVGTCAAAEPARRIPAGIELQRRGRARRPSRCLDDSLSTSANAVLKWWSTASRAMNSRMISDEPSKIRLMRKSRIARSTGIGARRARAANRPSRSRGRRGSAACRRRSASRARCCTSWRSPPRGGCRSCPRSASPTVRLGDRLHREGVRRHHARSSARPPRACRSARPTARARSPTCATTCEQRLAAAGARSRAA